MCGIFGQIGSPLERDRVTRVRSILRHRGPDTDGACVLDGATLVHTRLKIIDLSPAAAQPMANEDESVGVVFNGEISHSQDRRAPLVTAGHTFRSRADTEVSVHGYEQWGDAVVDKLDGMFAFGLWDQRRRRLLLARDRTGKKPLFYARLGQALLFGSEIKALLAAGVAPPIRPRGGARHPRARHAP